MHCRDILCAETKIIYSQTKWNYSEKEIFQMQAGDWDTCRNIENALFSSYLKAELKALIPK